MRKFIAATAALALTVALSSCSSESDDDLSVDLQPITEPGPGPFTDPVGTGTPLAAAPASADAQQVPAMDDSGEQPPGEEGHEEDEEYRDDEHPPAEEGYEEDEEEHEEDQHEEDESEEGGHEEDERYADRPTGAHEGGAEGLYGYTPQEVPCDKEALIAQLRADEDKGQAWAEAMDISAEDIERELHEMTPLVLRNDTLVTNHSYHGDGEWEGFLALLEAGTAVLVDEYGAPAVRCACGNPLREPEHGGDPVQPEDLPDVGSPEGEEAYEGEAWDGVVPAASTVVTPSQQRLTEIVATDVHTGEYGYLDVPGEDEYEEGEPGEAPENDESPEHEEYPDGEGEEPEHPEEGREEAPGAEQAPVDETPSE